MNESRKNEENGIELRDHVYDGIEEFDQKLPNWWLFTLYAAIVFAFVYWFFFAQTGVGPSNEEALAARMEVIEAALLEEQIALLDNTSLWEMSRNPIFVSAGAETFSSLCVQCHGADLKGGIGLNLVDAEWKHGSEPIQIYGVIQNGVDGPALPSWHSLGPKKMAELVAFILSHHEPPSS